METYLVAALVFVALGFACLVGEFAFPTGGIFLIVSLVLFVLAVGLLLLYGTRLEATVAVVGFCLGIPAVGWMMVQAWKTLALKRATESATAGSTITQAMAELSELDKLKGQIGKTLTPMRPSGLVELDGRRVDAMTEGMPIEAGTTIRCVEIRSGRVIVRKMDAVVPANDFDLNALQD